MRWSGPAGPRPLQHSCLPVWALGSKGTGARTSLSGPGQPQLGPVGVLCSFVHSQRCLQIKTRSIFLKMIGLLKLGIFIPRAEKGGIWN